MTNLICNMRRKDFLKLPKREWGQDIGHCTGIVIIPTKRVHDSGYICMDFASVVHGEAGYLLSDCSDVIHVGGLHSLIFNQGANVMWSIDCLRKSGYLHLFTLSGETFEVGPSISSFELKVIKQIKKVAS